jgi:hypothetical protein
MVLIADSGGRFHDREDARPEILFAETNAKLVALWRKIDERQPRHPKLTIVICLCGFARMARITLTWGGFRAPSAASAGSFCYWPPHGRRQWRWQTARTPYVKGYRDFMNGVPPGVQIRTDSYVDSGNEHSTIPQGHRRAVITIRNSVGKISSAGMILFNSANALAGYIGILRRTCLRAFILRQLMSFRFQTA